MLVALGKMGSFLGKWGFGLLAGGFALLTFPNAPGDSGVFAGTAFLFLAWNLNWPPSFWQLNGQKIVQWLEKRRGWSLDKGRKTLAAISVLLGLTTVVLGLFVGTNAAAMHNFLAGFLFGPSLMAGLTLIGLGYALHRRRVSSTLGPEEANNSPSRILS